MSPLQVQLHAADGEAMETEGRRGRVPYLQPQRWSAVKVSFNEKRDQARVTIPKSKLKRLGWLEELRDGESIELDPSLTPSEDGLIYKRVDF